MEDSFDSAKTMKTSEVKRKSRAELGKYVMELEKAPGITPVSPNERQTFSTLDRTSRLRMPAPIVEKYCEWLEQAQSKGIATS
ncbi:MAG: hypothetical protein HOC20_02385 [Chloroflexi bacterium]|jgi:hypothetical protein|nr:hypothetical protein [Chloroflexota bacterium]